MSATETATAVDQAAEARTTGCALVTNNTREFARVTGLTIEDWSG